MKIGQVPHEVCDLTVVLLGLRHVDHRWKIQTLKNALWELDWTKTRRHVGLGSPSKKSAVASIQEEEEKKEGGVYKLS